jgi:hypothetical protein
MAEYPLNLSTGLAIIDPYRTIFLALDKDLAIVMASQSHDQNGIIGTCFPNVLCCCRNQDFAVTTRDVLPALYSTIVTSIFLPPILSILQRAP